MRGVLNVWMRQSSALQAYKSGQRCLNALTSTCDWATGDAITADNQHQVDVIALFLLTAVQFITAGVQVRRALQYLHGVL